MAVNKFKGKFYEGTFAGGEGPVHGQSVSSEQETKGLLNPTSPQRHLKTTGGSGDGLMAGTPVEKNFDIHGASYRGPQNFQPKSEGEQHPFEVNKG